MTEPPKGNAVDDPVAVALEDITRPTHIAHAFAMKAAFAIIGVAGVGCTHCHRQSLWGKRAD